MAMYMVRARYTHEGLQGVLREGGTSRRNAISKLAEELGGRVESLYFAFGDVDVYCVMEMPDNVTAAAVSMTVSSSGAVSCELVTLLTPEEVDQTREVTVNYQPPGS
ncbi:MAG: GYD domain-containing protein [Euzebyaceae bacterium]|nr:GYD domain-containing protein [Euzebyaceae bacterium]